MYVILQKVQFLYYLRINCNEWFYMKFIKKMIICITIYFYINYNPYTTTISYSLLQYLLTANAHFAYAKQFVSPTLLTQRQSGVIIIFKSYT